MKKFINYENCVWQFIFFIPLPIQPFANLFTLTILDLSIHPNPMKSAPLHFVFLLMLISPVWLFGQANRNDAIYLKNGSILRGKIIENTPGSTLKIEMIGHNMLVFPYSEIERIETDKKESDFALPVEVLAGLHYYGGSSNSPGFSFSTLYHFPMRLSAGIGTGIDRFSYQVLPVYASFRYDIFKGSLTPYVYGLSGYSFPLSKASSTEWYSPVYKGGFMAGIGGGIRTDLGRHNALLFSIGYRLQKLHQTTSYYYWYSGDQSDVIERIDTFNRISVALEIMFK